MPADRKHLRLARVERCDELVVIGNGIDGLLIHLLDYVAFLQVRRAIGWINACYNNSVHAVRKVKLADKGGRQFADLDSSDSV